MSKTRITCLLLLCFFAYGFWPIKHEKYRDQYVVANQIERRFLNIMAHEGRSIYLTVKWKTYRDVRGFPPYYLRLTKQNAILFVTSGPNDDPIFHIINLNNGADIRIDGYNSGFGKCIGSGQMPGEKGSNYIKSEEPNEVTVVFCASGGMQIISLHLDTKTVESRDEPYK